MASPQMATRGSFFSCLHPENSTTDSTRKLIKIVLIFFSFEVFLCTKDKNDFQERQVNEIEKNQKWKCAPLNRYKKIAG